MIHYFEYNGKDSRDYDVYITDKSAYNKPQRDISFESVVGRSGDLIIDNGRYKNLDIEYNLRLFAKEIIGNNNPNDFAFAFSRVADWLRSNNNYCRLTDSYNPNYYRMAVVNSSISLTQKHPMIGDFSVTFNCKPYIYNFSGDNIIEIAQSGEVIYNYENSDSLPLIRAYSNNSSSPTTIVFAINERGFSVTNVLDYVDIDSEMMNVYKGETNMNANYSASSFPTFNIGSNTITFVANVSKLSIKPRWRSI